MCFYGNQWHLCDRRWRYRWDPLFVRSAKWYLYQRPMLREYLNLSKRSPCLLQPLQYNCDDLRVIFSRLDAIKLCIVFWEKIVVGFAKETRLRAQTWRKYSTTVRVGKVRRDPELFNSSVIKNCSILMILFTWQSITHFWLYRWTPETST